MFDSRNQSTADCDSIVQGLRDCSDYPLKRRASAICGGVKAESPNRSAS
jgi:hypothetical protein